MNSPRTASFFLTLFALGACTHAPKKPAPILVPPAPSALGRLSALKMPCLGHAMSALRAMPVGASPEEEKAIAFDNYYNAFLNVKGQSEYIACLEKEEGEDARKRRAQSEEWRRRAQEDADAAMKYFPESRRIVDAVESYSVLDEEKGRRRVVVTFRDGTTQTVDRLFDRKPPSRP